MRDFSFPLLSRVWTVLPGAMLLAQASSALPLFPVLTKVPVAMTTNREVARGIAFDGTNFLVVLQGDTLYATAGSPSNQLAAQLLSPDGTLVGIRIELQLSGSIPLVAFDGTNYLMAWVDSQATPPGVYGQFIDRIGAKSGDPFLVHSNTAVIEVGGLCYGHGMYMAVWSASAADSNTTLIQGRLVRPDGTLASDVLALGAAWSGDQRYPSAGVGATNFLVTWTAERSGTTTWDVLGRFVDTAGNASAELVISQTPAWAAYPVASASDGTNHLVVWSREAEPWRTCVSGHDPDGFLITTNLLFPMLFGRLLDGTVSTDQNEFFICRARWGRTSPALVFDGTNYLVAWNDHRDGALSSSPYGTWDLRRPYTNINVFVQFVSPSGLLLEHEFAAEPWPASYRRWGAANGPSLALGNGGVVLLRCLGYDAVRRSEDVMAILMRSRPPGAPTVVIEGKPTNGLLRLHIDGPANTHVFHLATNLNDWPSLTQFVVEGPSQNIFPINAHNVFTLPVAGFAGFVRAVDASEICRRNLRNQRWAIEQWALDNDKSNADNINLTEIFDPSRYLPEGRGTCPCGGVYCYLTVDDPPCCNIAGHVSP